MSKKLWLITISCLVLVGAMALSLIRLEPDTGNNSALPTLMVLDSDAENKMPIEVTADASETPIQVLEQIDLDAADIPPVLTRALPSARSVPAKSQIFTDEAVLQEVPQAAVANQIVVRFHAGTSPQDRKAFVQQLGGTVSENIEALDTYVINVPASIAQEPLPESSLVQSSEPDYLVVALEGNPVNDPLFGNQWSLPVIGAPTAWQVLPADAPSIIVAVIDSGICASHPELAGRILAGYDFVDNDTVPDDEYGHGCGVAGIISANGNNGIGISGIAPNAQIMPLRVLDERGLGTYSDLAAAIVYASDHGAHIINLSLGGAYPSAVLENAIHYAISRGVQVIAAAGNTGGNVLYPAAYTPVIAVASVDANLQLSSFSSFGAEIDLLAPGRDILTTSLDGQYISMNGTSFAAPHVAGIAALEMGLGRNLVINGQVVQIKLADEQIETLKPVPIASSTPLPTNADETVTLEGWLSLIYGDSNPAEAHQSITKVILSNDEGRWIAELALDLKQARLLTGRQVEVTGKAVGQFAQNESLPVLAVQSIQATDVNPTSDMSASITGSQAFVNILCKFSNIVSTPKTPTQVQNLFGLSSPGLDHYWQQISYGKINLTGTTTTTQWFTLPHARSYYIPNGGSANLDALATDCATVANASVFFPQYEGINFYFNGDLDCCAWGGGRFLSFDGLSKFYRTTWLPPWSQQHSVIAHEMGHGFGMPHSTGPADNPPISDIYVSKWDVMSDADGTCLIKPSAYGCLAPGVVTDNLDVAGWIDSNKKVTVASGTWQELNLQFLSLQASSSAYLQARVPIAGSASRYYTIEARNLQGYDQNTPGEGVIIHDVDINRTGNGGVAYVVDANDGNDDVNDAGARWITDEVFFDQTNNIRITILSSSATGFTVRVANNATKNDDFNSADIMPPMTLSLNTTVATTAGDDPIFSCVSGQKYHSVWYKFTPVQGGTLTVDTFGSDFDTVLAVWTGTRGNLVSQACNDDSNGHESYVELFVSPGTSYYIEVAGYFASSYGNLELNAVLDLPSTPGKPTLTVPANNALILDNTPTFFWNAVTDAYSYRVQVDDNSNFSSPVRDVSVFTNSYTPPALADAKYYWRVQAANINDVAGSWSSSSNFTLDTTAPDIPEIISPFDGFVSDGKNLKFSWLSSDGATIYELKLDITNPPLAIVSDSSARQYIPTMLIAGDYFWQVRAKDGAGNVSEWSDLYNLTIESPAKVAPIRNRYSTHTPTLSWGRVSWAEGYEIWLSSNSKVSKPDQSLLIEFGTTLSTVTPSLNNGIWYWKIRALRPNGKWGSWSVIDEFVIEVP